MKRRMTAKKALQITAEQYRWLAANPEAHSADWPGWEDYGFDMSVTSKDKDPLCQVAEGNCLNCPLIALWIQDSGALPRKQRLKSCLVRTSPLMVRQRLHRSYPEEDKESAYLATTKIYAEAEYALGNGVREPDLSIYEVKRKRRVREALSDEGLESEKRERISRVVSRRKRTSEGARRVR